MSPPEYAGQMYRRRMRWALRFASLAVVCFFGAGYTFPDNASVVLGLLGYVCFAVSLHERRAARDLL